MNKASDKLNELIAEQKRAIEFRAEKHREDMETFAAVYYFMALVVFIGAIAKQEMGLTIFGGMLLLFSIVLHVIIPEKID